MSETRTEESGNIRIENVGGIGGTEIAVPPGITVLTGRNATNRTSFLQGLMAVLGSDDASLKADADEGGVELALGGDTYTRRLRRQNGTVVMDGDPYLGDPALADLFAFLLESNEARRAVARNDDLREAIMRPVDTSAIESEIQRLERDRDEIDAALDDLEALSRRLPDLEADRVDLEARIEEKREELAAKESEIEDLDADVDETREEKAELEEKLQDLRDVRGELETARTRIESEQESIRALEDEREEVEAALEDLSDVPEERIQRIDEEIQHRRGQVQSIETTIGDLQSIIQFNQDTLDDDRPDVVSELQDVEGEGPVTDQLVEGTEDVVCWTCGSAVQRTQIEGTLDRLRALHREKTDARQSLREEISDLQDERGELEGQRREGETLDRKRSEIGDEIDERRERLDELADRRDRLADEVEQHEALVEDLQSEDYGGVIELHTEANQVEIELDRLERDLDDVHSEIEQVETELEERDQLEARREELGSELEGLRTRIEDIERASVDEFNEHMDEVLDLLDYENLERIWIERTEREHRNGRTKVSRGHFDVHVVRSTDDGTVYEDTVDHLSESEREVTGLVFALAGYLAHEVYEEVPFMVLDSVEAIDSDRIASLVDYFDGFADYLVVALLPEDAAALGDDAHHISEL